MVHLPLGCTSPLLWFLFLRLHCSFPRVGRKALGKAEIHIDPFAFPASKCKHISKGHLRGTQKSRRTHLRTIRLGRQSGG